MRGFNINGTLYKILNETEEHFKDKNVTREQIKEAYYYYWKHVRTVMKDKLMPTIIIPKFGTFKPHIGRLRAVLSFNNKNDIENEELKDVVERLNYEENKRKRNGK